MSGRLPIRTTIAEEVAWWESWPDMQPNIGRFGIVDWMWFQEAHEAGGMLHRIQLNRSPYAGRPELQRLVREAREATDALRAEIDRLTRDLAALATDADGANKSGRPATLVEGLGDE